MNQPAFVRILLDKQNAHSFLQPWMTERKCRFSFGIPRPNAAFGFLFFSVEQPTKKIQFHETVIVHVIPRNMTSVHLQIWIARFQI